MLIDSNFYFPTVHGQGITCSGEPSDICYASGRSCMAEAPLRFCSGVRVDIEKIGAFSFFNRDCSLRHIKSVGRFTMFGSEVMTGGGIHPVDSVSAHLIFQNMDSRWNQNFHHFYADRKKLNVLLEKQKKIESFKNGPIVIGNDVWIGNRVLILRGVTIGDGAVVGAGSVVTRDIPPYTVAAGAPARIVRMRFPEWVVEKLEQLQWWKYGPDILAGIDLTDPGEAVCRVEERICAGQKEYKGEYFLFRPDCREIIRINEKKKQVLYRF